MTAGTQPALSAHEWLSGINRGQTGISLKDLLGLLSQHLLDFIFFSIALAFRSVCSKGCSSVHLSESTWNYVNVWNWPELLKPDVIPIIQSSRRLKELAGRIYFKEQSSLIIKCIVSERYPVKGQAERILPQPLQSFLIFLVPTVNLDFSKLLIFGQCTLLA